MSFVGGKLSILADGSVFGPVSLTLPEGAIGSLPAAFGALFRDAPSILQGEVLWRGKPLPVSAAERARQGVYFLPAVVPTVHGLPLYAHLQRLGDTYGVDLSSRACLMEELRLLELSPDACDWGFNAGFSPRDHLSLELLQLKLLRPKLLVLECLARDALFGLWREVLASLRAEGTVILLLGCATDFAVELDAHAAPIWAGMGVSQDVARSESEDLGLKAPIKLSVNMRQEDLALARAFAAANGFEASAALDGGEPPWLIKRRQEAIDHVRSYSASLPTETLDVIPELKVTPATVNAVASAQEVFAGLQTMLSRQGVVLLDWPSALARHEELVKTYLGSVVGLGETPFTALNELMWDGKGGIFAYVPPGVRCTLPLQTFMASPYARTLVVVGKGAEAEFVEGCLGQEVAGAPVVELVLEEEARLRFVSLQSTPFVAGATRKARLGKCARLIWIDASVAPRRFAPQVDFAGDGAQTSLHSLHVFQDLPIEDHTLWRLSGKGRGCKVELNAHSLSLSGSLPRLAEFPNDSSDWECALKGSHLCLGGSLDGAEESSGDLGGSAVQTTVCPSAAELGYLAARGFDEPMEVLVEAFVAPFAAALPLEFAVEFVRLVNARLGLGDDGVA